MFSIDVGKCEVFRLRYLLQRVLRIGDASYSSVPGRVRVQVCLLCAGLKV